MALSRFAMWASVVSAIARAVRVPATTCVAIAKAGLSLTA
jgi:hypothetical protein